MIFAKSNLSGTASFLIFRPHFKGFRKINFDFFAKIKIEQGFFENFSIFEDALLGHE
jgi:hypothetical protein